MFFYRQRGTVKKMGEGKGIYIKRGRGKEGGGGWPERCLGRRRGGQNDALGIRDEKLFQLLLYPMKCASKTNLALIGAGDQAAK